MLTNSAFYLAARENFPAIARKADRKYLKYWKQQPSAEDPYSWFESAANALNEDMQREESLVECSEFFAYVTKIFPSASEEVRQCIDVSFVENLFWQVTPAKAAAYWNKLPPPLQALYVGFHNKPPI